MSSLRKLLPLLCLSLLLTGCFWRKKRQVAPTATPPPKPSLPTVQPAPPPPKIDTTSPNGTPPPSVSTNMPETPKPPQPKQPVRRARRNAVQPKVVDKPAADPGATGEPITPPAPRLGEILTDVQRTDLVKQCDQAMSRTRASLEKLSSKKLSASEAESVERVQVFLQQAETAKMRDPQTALQLAQRADVLALDLLKTLR